MPRLVCERPIIYVVEMPTTPDYDIALSFAGEDRGYVDQVAHLLRDLGVKVFYDIFEEADLWGKDLYTHLSDVYRKRARFTVIFISAAYGKKLWANHERMAAQSRAFHEAQEYILPARFDDTEIPGVLDTVGYVSLAGLTPEDLVSLITKKLVTSGGSVPTELVRKDFSTTSKLLTSHSTTLEVHAQDAEGTPISDCTVTALAENGTTVNGKTASNGRCSLTIKTRRTHQLLVAHPRYPSAFLDKIDPIDSIQVVLPRTENIGSVVVHSTGHIHGLVGRLNPILDTSGRRYLYADNIAIDGGKPQPATFAINVPIELEDADGTVVFATVKHIAARVSLIQFTRLT
jgi:hypothetical protein